MDYVTPFMVDSSNLLSTIENCLSKKTHPLRKLEHLQGRIGEIGGLYWLIRFDI